MDENEPIPNTTRNKIYEKNGKKWYSEPKNLKKLDVWSTQNKYW